MPGLAEAQSRLLQRGEWNGDCLEYKGEPNSSGYGTFRLPRGWNMRPDKTSIHRAAWILFRGDAPTGIDVCHKCDNSKCFNPKHLFLGTRSENMKDCVRKGRHYSPFRHYSYRGGYALV